MRHSPFTIGGVQSRQERASTTTVVPLQPHVLARSPRRAAAESRTFNKTHSNPQQGGRQTMRRMFVYAAILGFAGIAPAFAERLYVPVLGATAANGRALPTDVWVTNVAKTAAPVAARFLGAGEARTFAVG